MRSFRLSVPGNLLLAGEYAILENGGLGVAIAPNVRLVATVTPAPELTLVGVWPGGGETWQPERQGVEPLSFASNLLLALWQNSNQLRLPQVRVEVDSSAFFTPTGRKLGLGSSAALACALTAVWDRLHRGWDSYESTQKAIQAHRMAQGGRGSGYDVCASAWGGLGLFEGGVLPSWTPGPFDDLPPLALFQGPTEVKTVSSITSYTRWKDAQSCLAGEFLDASNQAVQSFFKARGWESRRRTWEVCKKIGLDLGAKIGSSAVMAPPKSLMGFFKASGAGNETGVIALEHETDRGVFDTDLTPIQLSEEGLRFED